MKNRLPIYEGDERIFTFSDVQALFHRQSKKIFCAALIGAVCFFGFTLIKTVPKYKVTAIFKEGVEQKGDNSSALIKVIGGMGGAQEPQTSFIMVSFQVLCPLVEKMGLQVSVSSKGSLIGKV